MAKQQADGGIMAASALAWHAVTGGDDSSENCDKRAGIVPVVL